MGTTLALIALLTPTDSMQVVYSLLTINSSLLLVCTLAIAAEAVISFTVVSGWGTLHHRFPAVGAGRNRGPSELSVVVGALFMAYLAATCALFVTGMFANSYSKFSRGNTWDIFGSSAYYALSGVFQLGDADPNDSIGRLVSAMINLNGAAFFFAVVSLVVGFAATAASAATDPQADPADDPVPDEDTLF